MSAVTRNETVAFRPMREVDLDGVVEVEAAAYGYPWSRQVFRDCLRADYSCWVVEQGATIIGYGIVSVSAGEAHILNLCVHPSRQGEGLGSALLEHLLDVAVAHHAEMVFLEVRPSNRAALALYRRAGFNEVGVRRGYYPAPGGREDALILSRHLATG